MLTMPHAQSDWPGANPPAFSRQHVARLWIASPVVKCNPMPGPGRPPSEAEASTQPGWLAGQQARQACRSCLLPGPYEKKLGTYLYLPLLLGKQEVDRALEVGR